MQHKVTAAIASSWFFYCTVGLLVLQAGWIALMARYPQAFDEQFHFGIIQLYAHQWSPFFWHQPAGADRLGPLPADTSFLYHYLLSFPYRVIAVFVHSQIVQIVLLRFINVGLFAWSLFIFRKLFAFAPTSKALNHLTLLFFVLVPVVPLLASQINYDNLFIPLVGLALLWTMRLVEAWRACKKVFPVDYAIRLTLLCLLASTVKYAFLPIFVALMIALSVIAWRSRRGLLLSFRQQVLALSRLRLGFYVLLFVISAILWAGVYGQNVVRYHTPLPACDRVLSVERCLVYPPWGRDYQFEHDGSMKPSARHISDIKQYAQLWVQQSLTELVFAISSNFEPDGVTVEYHVANPLPVLSFLAKWIFVGGVILAALFCWRLWRYALFRIGALVALLYVSALWLEDFQAYLHTGYPVAVHGRYLLPVLPVMLIAISSCLSWLVHSVGSRLFPNLSKRMWLVGVVVLFLLLQGGGFITYIVRSDEGWLGDESPKVAKINRVATKALKPVIIGH